jgi:hypothetical protein
LLGFISLFLYFGHLSPPFIEGNAMKSTGLIVFPVFLDFSQLLIIFIAINYGCSVVDFLKSGCFTNNSRFSLKLGCK